MLNVVLDDSGQGLAEYGVLLGFLAIACIAAAAYLGASLSANYKNISSVYP